MASPYDSLVDTGAIASLKRDILIEASDDIYYLAHIRRRFVEDAGAEAAKVATASPRHRTRCQESLFPGHVGKRKGGVWNDHEDRQRTLWTRGQIPIAFGHAVRFVSYCYRNREWMGGTLSNASSWIVKSRYIPPTLGDIGWSLHKTQLT